MHGGRDLTVPPARILNPNIVGMRCIRCKEDYPVADYLEGCPACQASKIPANLALTYREFPSSSSEFRASDWLAYPGGPVLGEGNTPTVSLPALATQVGIATLRAKYEGSNPTGSHKDRMSALFIQRVREAGFEAVAIASSGNAGASLAAYAANAGVACTVVTTTRMNANWRRAIEMHGARLIFAPTPEERWRLVGEGARSGEWYPANNYLTPAVGSNPFGVDGYRAIAFEIFRDWPEMPATDVLVPTSRGDVLWGVAQGFYELRNAGYIADVPRVHAVEPFPRIELVLEGLDFRTSVDGESLLSSLKGNTVAFQALDALRKTGGSAVSVDERDVIDDQLRMSRAGLYLELSSAAALTGLSQLRRRGKIPADAHAVLLTTSHGYKDGSEVGNRASGPPLPNSPEADWKEESPWPI